MNNEEKLPSMKNMTSFFLPELLVVITGTLIFNFDKREVEI
jgi:hypothetical protein